MVLCCAKWIWCLTAALAVLVLFYLGGWLVCLIVYLGCGLRCGVALLCIWSVNSVVVMGSYGMVLVCVVWLLMWCFDVCFVAEGCCVVMVVWFYAVDTIWCLGLFGWCFGCLWTGLLVVVGFLFVCIIFGCVLVYG